MSMATARRTKRTPARRDDHSEAAAGSREPPWLVVRAARHNNLKNIDVGIPLGRFVCVTGVSGSGKSSLVNDIIREQLARDLNGAEKVKPGSHDGIDGLEHLDKVIDIDQSPIGRTPRSNPATYIKLFDQIRDLFARLPDSQLRGYKPGRFSFNVPSGQTRGGRCDACEGNGANRVEMDFLADVWVPCPICEGRRFNHETLQVLYKGKSIHDVLDMDVQEALEHFEAIPRIKAMLETLHDVGLDYLKLGQSSTTLSGGEAQRIKLGRELVKRSTGRTLYLLDEPTTGLHFEDIKRLLAVLHGFVDAGNSVICIEHNLDVIKTADWVIDLGPDGGEGGGRVVVAGTPERVAACRESYTGAVLASVIRGNKSRKVERSKSRKKRSAGRGAAGFTDAGSEGGPSKKRRSDAIHVIGAREHNLKNITVSVPRGRMTVCSGVSGSGKSSFAIDTVYTEGQRRYVESLSAYARQFLGQLQKPKVDHVYGLSPAIAIEQKAASKSPRSTVGTVTEIYDYMRVLWARVGQPYCPKCDEPIGTQSADEIVEAVTSMPDGTRLLLCAPIERGAGESWDALFARCKANGYARVRVDGKVRELTEDLNVDGRRRHTVELVVDRVSVRARARGRITDSVEQCLAAGDGVLLAVDAESGRARRLSQHFSCDTCGTGYDELTPHHFSFNSRMGWCPHCEGLGLQRGTRPDAVVARPRRSILDGAIAGWEEAERRPLLRAMLVALAGAIGFDAAAAYETLSEADRHALLFGLGDRWIEAGPSGAADQARTDQSRDDQSRDRKGAVRQASTPQHGDDTGHGHDERGRGTRASNQSRDRKGAVFSRTSGSAEPANQAPLHEQHQPLPDGRGSDRNGDAAAHGHDERGRGTRARLRFQWKGFFPAIDEATKMSWRHRARMEHLVTDVGCQRCEGGRIRPEPAAVRLGGRSIVEVCRLSLAEAAGFFRSLKLDRRQARVAGELLHEIKSRLRFLLDVGLDYLSLDRAAPALSGGESQRIRLASQIGSGLTGVLYVLDEPTIGLHPRDNRRLIAALHRLRDLGNTLLMVEHDREVIEASDHVIDFGPGAGAAGGHVVATGTPKAIRRKRGTLTGRYLANKEAIVVPTNRRPVDWPGGPPDNGTAPDSRPAPPALIVVGARQNNLRSIDAAFPIGRFICVTGVSGSGKSSLVTEILYPALASRIHRARLTPGGHEEIRGTDHVDKIINVDQQPIGNSPSSNAATYTGVFDEIRDLFAKMPDSRIRGYTANRFSFNRPGGRCDDCDGLGQVCHEMHFLPDVWVPCETCGGRRYNRETLDVRYRARNIADVLDMPASAALEHFAAVPKVRRMLQTLGDVGLGYLSLGQAAPTLSGGEAQRVKLAAELGRPNTGKTLYILDEPTTGLHFEDLRKLLDVLHRLVDLGNTVVCIEHNLDLIKTADWIIDLGPEAGDAGGGIVAEGTPEHVAGVKASHTGRILADVLSAGPHGEREVFDPAAAAARAHQVELPETPGVKMPWERNGRQWHTESRVSRDGKKIEWEGRALAYIADSIERLGGDRLLPTDWRDRARVEIRAKAPKGLAQSTCPWFFHARTGGRWLLDMTFRFPRRTFTQSGLNGRLKIKTLDEREDIPIYGPEPRARLRRSSAEGMEDVRLLVYDRKEIATPGFRWFLAKAFKSYVGHIDRLAADAALAAPWKTDGRAWHLSQKSICSRQGKMWKPMTLLELIGQMNRAVPDLEIVWDKKVLVGLRSRAGGRLGWIGTSNRYGLRVDVQVPSGRFTPTMIEHLGMDPEIRNEKGTSRISFWVQTADQVHGPTLKSVMQASAGRVGA